MPIYSNHSSSTLNSILAYLICFIAFSCQKNQEYIADTHLSGKIVTIKNDSLNLLDCQFLDIQKINVDSIGQFSVNLNLPTGYYYLTFDNYRYNIFLKQGSTLNLVVDSSGTQKFDGQLAVENQFIVNKKNLKNPILNAVWSPRFIDLPEKEFLQKSDSIALIKKQFLDQFKDSLPEYYYKLERDIIDFERRSRLLSYEYRRNFDPNNPSVSNGFPDAMKNLDVNNEKWAHVGEYIELLDKWLSFKPAIPRKKGQDRYVHYVDNLKQQIINKNIRTVIASRLLRVDFWKTKELDRLYEEVKPLVFDTRFETDFADAYASLKKVAKGQPAPEFSLPNYNGDIVNMKDYRGNYIYIDLWATWCGPCIQLFPEVLKLEKKFEGRNIAFVSICYDSKKGRWKEIIEMKQPGGEQLFADDGSIGILNIPGITLPGFILIDPQGNFYDANADFPSDKNLVRQLDELLTVYETTSS